jgi:hypothetical protein
MAGRTIARVNLLNQSGLMCSSGPPSRGYRAMGSDGYIARHDDRLTRELCWNDSYIILHKNMDPIASPPTQRFLQSATRDLGNSRFEKSHHPILQIQIPQREIKPRIVPTYRVGLARPPSVMRKKRPSGRTTPNVDDPRRELPSLFEDQLYY